MPNTIPYDADLAYIHDTGFGSFARNSAPGLLKIISQCGDPSRLVVDLGCGSGIWARALVEAGYQVSGVDISAAMIEMARQRVPEATFQVGSFVDAAVPTCRAVTALGEVVNYLFDANNSLSMLHKVCQRVFETLVSGGAFIFDFAEPGRCRGLKQGFWEGEDWACLVDFLHDEPKQQLTRRIVTFRKVGNIPSPRRNALSAIVREDRRGRNSAKCGISIRDRTGFRSRDVSRRSGRRRGTENLVM